MRYRYITIDYAFTWWEWVKRWIKPSRDGRRWVDIDEETSFEITTFDQWVYFLNRCYVVRLV